MNTTKVAVVKGFPLEKLGELKRMKLEDDKKSGEAGAAVHFPPVYMPRGVADGNGKMVVLRPRLCARGGGDNSHAASGCVGWGKC